MSEIDKKRIENSVNEFLLALGVEDENLLYETPHRVSRMCEEIFEGMLYSNDQIAEMFGKTFEHNGEELVIEKNIPIFSFCEHHLALMYNMEVHVAYIPKGKVIGLSKIARIADMVGKRLQLQERIGSDIADIMIKATGCEDIMVIVEGEHSCVTMRGIKKRGTKTRTITSKGKFQNDYLLQQLIMDNIG